jgi:ribosomal protein S18 acetylase RimI-like enzyme
MTTASIRRAGPADLDALAALFDAYRRFYEQPADLARARAFIDARLARGDSTILVAEDAAPGALAGFCQLYPTWCSVAAAPVMILSDLFVAEAARRAGTGRALMRAAQAHGREAGVARLDLQTAHTNTRAQALYESLGWRLDTAYRTYSIDPRASRP